MAMWYSILWALILVMPFSADDYSMEYYRALAVVESNGLVFWSPPTKFRSTCPVSIFKFWQTHRLRQQQRQRQRSCPLVATYQVSINLSCEYFQVLTKTKTTVLSSGPTHQVSSHMSSEYSPLDTFVYCFCYFPSFFEFWVLLWTVKLVLSTVFW